MKKSNLLLSLFILLYVSVSAQDYAPAETSHISTKGFYIGSEQDVFVDIVNLDRFNEDRNYTMGAVYGKVGVYTNRNYFILPWIRRNISGLLVEKDSKRYRNIYRVLFDESKCEKFASSFDIRAGGFTPRDLISTDPVTDDRPYSSIVSFNSHISRRVGIKKRNKTGEVKIDKDGNAVIKNYGVSSSFGFGILGTSVGRWFQSKSHREHWFGSTRDVPLGWHNQISHDGGLVFLYKLGLDKPLMKDIKLRVCKKRDDTKKCHCRCLFNEGIKAKNLKDEDTACEFTECASVFQATLNTEVMLGYHINMAVGVNLRLGVFNAPFWRGYNSLRDMSSNASKPVVKNFQCYIYFKPRIRLIGYNAMLQGQMIDGLSFGTTNFYFSPSQLKRVIYEFETGVTVKLFDWTLTFEPFSGRSPEFDFLGARTRWHYWGTMNIALDLNPN